MAASGDVLAVSAPLRNDGAGAVYVFERMDDGYWQQKAELSDGLANAGDSLGWSLDLEGDILWGATAWMVRSLLGLES